MDKKETVPLDSVLREAWSKLTDKKVSYFVYKNKFPMLEAIVGIEPKRERGNFVGLFCKECGWRGLHSEATSKPYDAEYFCYCPKCGEPEPEERLMKRQVRQRYFSKEQKEVICEAMKLVLSLEQERVKKNLKEKSSRGREQG